MSIKTLKVRVKDKHAKELNRQARAVNYVWNFANDLSHKKLQRENVWVSGFDLSKYTSGSSKGLDLLAATVQLVCEEYAVKRRQAKKAKLSWRKSFGSRRSLGWIPFKKGTTKFKNGQLIIHSKHYSIWDSYDLSQYEFRSACFTEDARGRWYFCVVVEVKQEKTKGASSVGIDLGCKDAATDSNGTIVKGREYRRLEEKLGNAQRAKKKRQVKLIHAKIKNRRADTLHKYSRMLVDQNAVIFVGNVSSSKLVKTKMAKSVLDAGWYSLKIMLKYKSEHAGVIYQEVNEAYTTQTCSSCGAMPDSRPRGIAGLGIREWTCDCGVTHDRDVNAAKNILALGHQGLAVGAAA